MIATIAGKVARGVSEVALEDFGIVVGLLLNKFWVGSLLGYRSLRF